MSKFYFYKVGRHFVLCDRHDAERYRIDMTRKHRLDVFNCSTTNVKLPSHVLVQRKLVCVVANSRDDAVAWLKTQKWSEL